MTRHIVRCAQSACDRLKRLQGSGVDLLEELQMLSLEIAATSLFSMEAATFGPEMRRLVGQRLYSPAFLTARLAARSHEICGTTVPAGSIVLLPYWLLHRNPLWWPRPEVFDPLRFLNAGEPQRLTYLPFGVGRHVCIGAQLAMTEAVLAMAHLVSAFNIEMAQQRPLLPVGRISTRPDHAPRFVLRAR